jgi:HlyD family secretion protein
MTLKRLLFNKFTLLILLVAIAAGGWMLWQSRSTEVKYRTTEARTADITQAVSANGTLKPVVLVNVGTQVSGTVKKLHVDFNDRVKQGQVLLELDPAVLNAQVEQTQANLASARASLDLATANEQRAQTLFKQNYISRQELDQAIQQARAARAQVAQITAQLGRDRTNLGYTIIRSPVSGVVVARAVDIGQTVAASFSTPTLFQIAQDLRQMQIDTAFAEADIGSIKPGQPVQFTVDAYPNRNFSAAVKQVRLNATVTQNVVTYNVVVAVDNPDAILLPSMTAYVSVVTAQRANVLTVPNAALRFRPPAAGAAPAAPAKRDVLAKAPPPEGAAADSGNGAAPAEKTTRRRPASKSNGSSDAKGAPRGTPQNAATGTDQPMVTRGVVYVLGADKQLRRVPLQLGISDGRVTEVLGGEIKAGEQIVTGIEDASAPAAGPATGTFRMRLF